MSPNDEAAYRQRIAQREAENARLSQRLEAITADRRELYQRVYGPTSQQRMAIEEECSVLLRTHDTESTLRWLAEMGLLPRKSN